MRMTLISAAVFLRCVTLTGGIYLDAAVRFADCMIEHGRDRYGAVHSPLFAVLLLRSEQPRIAPQPLFDSEIQYDWQRKLENPFKRFNYNRCLNYPEGLGPEGAHKITLTGCDPYEDRALYEFLFDLSRITGNGRYRREAEKALRWWFENTQAENGLYPWGEHLGWDFENDCPTYFAGVSKHLYAACYHEVKDTIPFLDSLSAVPAGEPGGLTPLERYALGVWQAHYWDKERCVFCRHGDYTGADDRSGSLNGFPAHYGAYLRLWVKTLLTTENAAVGKQMTDIIDRTLSAQIARARQYGFIPMTYAPDLKGGEPERNSQSPRLGLIAAELAGEIGAAHPDLQRKLARLAELLSPAVERTASAPPLPAADLAHEHDSRKHAREIMRYLDWHRENGRDPEYLQAAAKLADRARSLFCDAQSPLPRAYAGPLRRTPSGDRFPDFYFREARLMHAFALLGNELDAE